MSWSSWASLPLLIFCILCPASIFASELIPSVFPKPTENPHSQGQGHGHRLDPTEELADSKRSNGSDLSKLTVKVADLLGARWFDEHRQITVYHSVEIVDAMLVDTKQLSLRIEFYLQQRWKLTGLKLPPGLFKEDDPHHFFITAKDVVLQHMWSPDSYISSSRDSGTVRSTSLKNIVYIYPDNTIVFRAKMFANVACTTNFAWYPKNNHACLLAIEGYTYHDEFVRYQWEHDNENHHAVTTKMERPLQYDLRGVNFTNGSIKRGNRDMMYPYVSIKFLFERKLGNSFIQIYIPTTLVVILTSFNFWIGLDAIPARMSLLITSMLTLVTMHVGTKGTIPPVHYITMMDIWMVGCMAYVFSAVCVFVAVKYMHWTLHHIPENKYKVPVVDEEKKLNEYIKIIRSSLNPSPNPEEDKDNKNKANPGGPEDPGLEPGPAPAAPETGTSRTPLPSIQTRDDDLSVSLDTVVLEGMEFNNYRYRRDKIGDKVKFCKGKCLEGRELWLKVDMCCRIGFPLMFISFNCIYWPVILKASRKEAEISL